jgi:hypothetical protein
MSIGYREAQRVTETLTKKAMFMVDVGVLRPFSLTVRTFRGVTDEPSDG